MQMTKVVTLSQTATIGLLLSKILQLTSHPGGIQNVLPCIPYWVLISPRRTSCYSEDYYHEDRPPYDVCFIIKINSIIDRSTGQRLDSCWSLGTGLLNHVSPSSPSTELALWFPTSPCFALDIESPVISIRRSRYLPCSRLDHPLFDRLLLWFLCLLRWHLPPPWCM
jgi:hypothetical protein